MKQILVSALCGLFAYTLTCSADVSGKYFPINLNADVQINTDSALQIEFTWDAEWADELAAFDVTDEFTDSGESSLRIYGDPWADVSLFVGDFSALSAAGIAGPVMFSAMLAYDLTIVSVNQPDTGTLGMVTATAGTRTMTYSFTRNVPDGGNTLLLLSLGVGGLAWVHRRKVTAGV